MSKRERTRRIKAAIALVLVLASGVIASTLSDSQPSPADQNRIATSVAPADSQSQVVINELGKLPTKGRAPKTNYAREQFGAGWASIDSCDMRQYILARDMTKLRQADDGCTVLSGRLADPYTGKFIDFKRGRGSSSAVQIDHVVALSDAWQKGAQALDESVRAEFYNDPLNLLAVDGKANNQKSDGDAATWLPPNHRYRCQYVARQVAVKRKYQLWVTPAERGAIVKVLASCPGQKLPLEVAA